MSHQLGKNFMNIRDVAPTGIRFPASGNAKIPGRCAGATFVVLSHLPPDRAVQRFPHPFARRGAKNYPPRRQIPDFA
jgi:hypothetical protein